MKIVGLTGGIGSGKTTVARMFESFGVPIYVADDEAKKLANSSKVIRKHLVKLLGDETYIDGVLNRQFVADKIFTDKELLQKVNAIIHPKVASHFKKWQKKQRGSYCIKEAAILFENGSYKNCDLNILVTAPLNERIKRVMARDNSTLESVQRRIDNQWSDEIKAELADFLIENTDLRNTLKQVEKIHAALS